MRIRLTDRAIGALKPPNRGSALTFDTDIRGYGLRVTARGIKSFVLDYRIDGRQRRYTIGRWLQDGPWPAAKARIEANRLRREIDLGRDPLAEREDARNAPAISELADQFMAEHVKRKRRVSTGEGYQGIVDQHIKPALGKRKVALLSHTEVEHWFSAIAEKTPIRANRCLAVLSRMMTFAGRSDNPCKGIERRRENMRRRYGKPEEVKALCLALEASGDRTMASAVLLLLLTGARRSEVLLAKWAQFDTQRGTWIKPASATKQKREHIVPISAAAMTVLASIDRTGPELFTGTFESNKHRLRMCFDKARAAAGAPDLRLHDLRHYAELGTMPSKMASVSCGAARLTAHTRHRFSAYNPLRKAIS